VLENACIDKELGIVFEYTAPGTPQQNGIIERAFVTMLGKNKGDIERRRNGQKKTSSILDGSS